MVREPHAVLGVAIGATPDQVKAAYRRKAQQHHPDRHPNDPAAAGRFQEIQAAYQTLNGGSRGTSAGPTAGQPDFEDLFNIFDQVFRRAQAPVVVVQMSLEAIASGGHHTFDVDTPESCTCTLARRARCPICHGTGVLRHRRHSYEVDIPPGAPDGLQLRAHIKGKKETEQMVVIQTQPHAIFERQGSDLIRPIAVDYPSLVLGGDLETQGLHGPVKLKLPAGVRPGQNVRLAGHGLPRMEGGHGDLYLHVAVTIPDRLTARQRKAMEELAAALSEP